MATARWIKGILERRGVAYKELHHPEVFTAQEVAQTERISGHRLAKVVVVLADGRPVELIVPASRRVVLERVGELLGARDVRLASEAEMGRIFTDCESGAIPPLRHWQDVGVLMDARMEVEGDIFFQAGTHQDVIRLKFEDWFLVVKPRVESFTELESAHSQAVFFDREAGGVADAESAESKQAQDPRRESGLPGGGRGRIDEVGHSGVYPGSGPYPDGEPEIRTPGAWVHGQRDAEGREVEGGSELTYLGNGTLLGGATPPPSGPPQRPHDAPDRRD